MKKTIIISTLFVILLLSIVPSISAVQHTTVRETIKERYVEQLNILKEQKIQFGDLFDKEQLKTILGETVVIDFANIYLLICCLMITAFMGKPSLGRMAYNAFTIYTILHEFKTGELIPRCNKFYAGLIGMPVLVLGSFIYSISKNKALGTIAMFLSSLIYYVIILLGVNADAA